MDDALGQDLERVDGDRTDALQFFSMQLFKVVAQTHQLGSMPYAFFIPGLLGLGRHLGPDGLLGVAQLFSMTSIALLAQTRPVRHGGRARAEHRQLGPMFGVLSDPSQVGRMPLRCFVPDHPDDGLQLGLGLIHRIHLSKILTATGSTVTTYENSAQAKAAATNDNPSLVMLDASLTDAVDTLKWAKSVGSARTELRELAKNVPANCSVELWILVDRAKEFVKETILAKEGK